MRPLAERPSTIPAAVDGESKSWVGGAPTPRGARPEPCPGVAGQRAVHGGPGCDPHNCGEVFVDSPQQYPSNPCTGGTLYPDIAIGSTVTVKSGSKELAVRELGG
jgi:hypothetical protein